MFFRSRAAVRKSGGSSAEGAGAFANSGVMIDSSVQVFAGRAPVSGYLLQVEQALAASDFQGRESELAQLVAFCAHDVPADRHGASYWRWVAPAWAGKSALLAHFVLHPPPGVDVVSFFITSRMTSQNDAAAFCEVVQRQVYALLGEEEPLSTPATRSEQMLLALHRAAQGCAARGRRLVLVVDGLDEDRGVIAGADGHSIAALLPRVPTHGMRIVVAGRPHPPVPGDVPADHPLRTTRIDHRLEPSPRARAARWDAEEDLLRLRDGGGLGWDLVALTVAAGGGLSAPDFAELTGSLARLVERELSTVNGRSFRQRSGHWTSAGPPVFLFTHEEIRRAAAELVTDQELAAHHSRLYRWADAYRHAGWPDGTPEYLLSGYTQLLREQGDTSRLVALACDTRRQERLWRASEADLEALSAVSAAFDLVLADAGRRGDQDVSVALRLAASRDGLHNRTTPLSPALIALWARCGHPARAVHLAESQRDAQDRVAALSAIAGALAAARPEQAAALLDGADSTKDRNSFLSAIAKGLAGSGRPAEAMRTARHISDPECRAEAFVAAVGALAGVSRSAAAAQEEARARGTDVDSWVLEAVDAVMAVPNTVSRSALGASLAAALSRLGEHRRALALVEWVVSRPTDSGDAVRRAQCLALFAQGMSTAPGLAAQAAKFAVASARLAADIDDPDGVDWVYPHVAASLEATGHQQQAIDLVSRFLNDPEDGLVEIGIAAAEAGGLDRALKLAERITEPIYRARVLNAVGRMTAGSRDPARTLRLARQARDATDEVPYLYWQVALSADTADFLLRAGQEERAHAVVERATNMARRGRVPRVHTLIKLAVAAHRYGHWGDAARLIHRAEQAADASADYARVLNLAEVAEGLHHTGRPAEADELLRRVIHESRTLADRAEHAEGLKRVAEAFGRIGKPEEAAELAQEILGLAGTADSPSRRRWDTYAAAGALLATGEIDAVLRLEGGLPDHAVNEILTGVVKKLVDAGDLAVAEQITDWQRDEHALGYLAAGAAATGNVARAAALLEEISTPVLREAATPAVVKALSRAGARPAARALADALTMPDHRGKALAAIAQSLGPCPQGRLVMVEALCCVPWEHVPEEIAGVVPEHLPLLTDLVPTEGQGPPPKIIRSWITVG
ncbi:tetratricopeptide repeat protein [Streptomyces sp. YS-3]|uniref:tetratricopeptide repeat protein n=1 Tax=Streptomyces sp. YS-3 TaxID=3381352 RepID=UPI0038623F5B